MRIPKHATLIQRHLQARLKQLQASGPILAASLVTIEKKCGRTGCHCCHGKGHPGHYLTCKQNGKTHTVYVPLDLLKEVKSWIREHRRLKTVMRQVSQLAMAKVQTHATDKRRKAGRS